MRDFRKLNVWQKAHQLTIDTYKATANFPEEEIYGITSQLRRASVSIPANIAEGCGREGNAELGHFLKIASGSASELEYHLLLANELNFLDNSNYKLLNEKVIEIKKMLTVLIQKLRAEN